MAERSEASGSPQASTGKHGEQNDDGIDLSLIRECLKLTVAERLRKGDRACLDALRLLEYGRRNRQQQSHARGDC